MDDERIHLTVDPGVGAILTQLADGQRKRGDWLSRMAQKLVAGWELMDPDDLAQLRAAAKAAGDGSAANGQGLGHGAALDARLAALEARLAQLEAG